MPPDPRINHWGSYRDLGNWPELGGGWIYYNPRHLPVTALTAMHSNANRDEDMVIVWYHILICNTLGGHNDRKRDAKRYDAKVDE